MSNQAETLRGLIHEATDRQLAGRNTFDNPTIILAYAALAYNDTEAWRERALSRAIELMFDVFPDLQCDYSELRVQETNENVNIITGEDN